MYCYSAVIDFAFCRFGWLFYFRSYKTLHANFKKAFTFFVYYLWFCDFLDMDVNPDAFISVCIYAGIHTGRQHNLPGL
jgi:hypothetical protein